MKTRQSSFELQSAEINEKLSLLQGLGSVWAHQIESANKIRNHLTSFSDIALCVLPTGSGKLI